MTLELLGVDDGPVVDGVEELSLRTDKGHILCRFHEAPAGEAAVIWVGGAGGGLDGPAGGLYSRLAGQLVQDRIASLRVHYRQPNQLENCVLDMLLSRAYLGFRGRRRLALVGHSFGGAVVIAAGAISEEVVAVAALSSQTHGTAAVEDLSPRPLLLMHGTADEVLPDTCSRDLHRRARDPKRMILYPGCRHGLDECRAEVDRDLSAWLREVLAG